MWIMGHNDKEYFILGIPEGEEKGAYLKQWPKTLKPGDNWTSGSVRPKGSWIGWTWIGLHWDMLLVNSQRKNFDNNKRKTKNSRSPAVPITGHWRTCSSSWISIWHQSTPWMASGTRPSRTAPWALFVAPSCTSIMTEDLSHCPSHTDNKVFLALKK